MNSNPKAKGFTLVELLVVISIIALLIAILLPALSRVRGQTKRVHCAANLKQIGMALQMYADDHQDRFPTWSAWHVWGYFGSSQDGTAGDDPGPAWTELLRDEGSLPDIEVLRCKAFPTKVAVSYFQSAYAAWERMMAQTTRRGLVRYPAEFVLAGDCTNPMFYAPPFGTNAALNINDADMDNATQRSLDWNNPIHLKTTNNVVFADGHVTGYAKFKPEEMTHDIAERGVDWGEIP